MKLFFIISFMHFAECRMLWIISVFYLYEEDTQFCRCKHRYLFHTKTRFNNTQPETQYKSWCFSENEGGVCCIPPQEIFEYMCLWFMNILRRTQQSCNSGRLSPRLDVPQYRAALGAFLRGSGQPLALQVLWLRVTNVLVPVIAEYRLGEAIG